MIQQFYFWVKEIKLLSQRDIGTIMFIRALFTIIKMGTTYVHWQLNGYVVVQSLSHVWLFVTPWTAAHQAYSCPSPSPGACSNSCPLSQWCHPTISSSVVPFSSCLQYFPASGSFPMSQLVTSGGQNMGVSASASVNPMNIQDWFPVGLTSLISYRPKDSQKFSNTTVQKHQFFSAQLSL